MHTIKIIKNSKVEPFFVKGTSHILDKYPTVSNYNDLKKRWLSEFGATISDDKETLIFEDSKKLTMFSLSYL